MQDNSILLDIETEPMELDTNVEIMEEGSNEDLCQRKDVNAVIEEMSDTSPPYLHLAILHCHIDAIKDVLKGGADVNVRNKAGETPLHIAAGAGQLQTVKLLLKHRADVNAETNLKLTSLHIAVRKGNAKLVKFLILHSYSMNTNSRDHMGNTPLYNAVKRGNLEIVKMLLMADADPNIRNNDGDSPFFLALKMGRTNLILVLFKYNAKPEQKTAKGEGPMHLACRYCKDLVIIDRLILRKLSVHSVTLDGSSTLHYAVMNEDNTARLSMVSILLSYGVKPDVIDNNNCSPIMTAIKNLDCLIIRELIDAGASLTIADSRTGLSPLLMALKQGSYRVARLLMKQRWLNIRHICNHNQENALHLAIKHLQDKDERFVMVEDLKRKYVDIKQRSLENKTPVDLAIETKDEALVYIMLDAVDLDEKREILDFNALLMFAITVENLDKVNLMLRNGAQAENRCFILLATFLANRSILRKLLEFGADVNALDDEGDSILEIAIKRQLTEIVELFLLFGADVNRVHRGRIPLMLATDMMKGWGKYTNAALDIVRLLLKQIALMQHQGNFVNELNHQFIQKSRFTVLDNFTSEIETWNNVLENMRTMPVTDDTSTTYYDLIVRPNSALIKVYAGNEKLRAAAKTCKERYILYDFSDIIQMKYAQCLQRKNLVGVVRPSLHEIFHSKLPYELTYKIVDYMSSNDMRRYVKLAFPKIELNQQLDW